MSGIVTVTTTVDGEQQVKTYPHDRASIEFVEHSIDVAGVPLVQHIEIKVAFDPPVICPRDHSPEAVERVAAVLYGRLAGSTDELAREILDAIAQP